MVLRHENSFHLWTTSRERDAREAPVPIHRLPLWAMRLESAPLCSTTQTGAKDTEKHRHRETGGCRGVEGGMSPLREA